jgi:hypothetical protein
MAKLDPMNDRPLLVRIDPWRARIRLLVAERYADPRQSEAAALLKAALEGMNPFDWPEFGFYGRVSSGSFSEIGRPRPLTHETFRRLRNAPSRLRCSLPTPDNGNWTVRQT